MKKRYGQTMQLLIGIGMVLSVILMVSGVFYTLKNNIAVGFFDIGIGLIMTVYLIIFYYKRKRLAEDYTRILGIEDNAVSSNIMSSFPIPMTVVHMDGSIRWYNDKFSELMGNKDVFNHMLEKVLPELKWATILKNASNVNMSINIKNSSYNVIGNMIKDRSVSASADEDKYSIYLYFIDKTTQLKLQKLYEDEKTDIAIINIDNYEEVFQRIDDSIQQQIMSQIRKFVNEWAKTGDAIIKSTDRDRYFVLFEHKYLETFAKNKFNIIDKIRAIGDENNVPVSISIGIGCGGGINNNESAARNALDMALGRGGDQVCIKDDMQYRFFGGKSREYEKSTRVKTRAMAVALKDFIRKSDKVIFVGHSGADYDCFGAAMGLQRAVRVLGKTPYIVHDNNSQAIKPLYDIIHDMPEYKGMFLSVEEALEKINSDTLIVILDTHRPSILPDVRLVEYASKIVLIDHHRRSTEFINPCSLVYHEPYASSTCEMATELIEYMDLGTSLTKIEAESLYTGILMDTKNFMIKTGVRTFEAASYLRRMGLNTIAVKKLFNVDKADYDHKVDIVKTAKTVAPHIAIAKTYDKFSNIKVIASQAADEMLNIDDIKASFVVYPMDGAAGISARSLGDINVQLITEALGGGGHMTVAGAQLKGRSIDQTVELVQKAVNQYLKDNK